MTDNSLPTFKITMWPDSAYQRQIKGYAIFAWNDEWERGGVSHGPTLTEEHLVALLRSMEPEQLERVLCEVRK